MGDSARFISFFHSIRSGAVDRTLAERLGDGGRLSSLPASY